MRIFHKVIVVVFIISCLIFSATLYSKKDISSHSPTITSSIDRLEIKIADEGNRKRLLDGLQAYDEEDGDLTDKIFVSHISDFTEPGMKEIKYSVIDHDGNIALLSRTVIYTDYTAPIIDIIKEPVCKMGEELDIFELISINDSYDGDITNQAEVDTSQVNMNEPGLYPVNINAINSMGDSSSYCMYIHVKKETENKAAVKLTQYSVRLKKDEAFNEMDYVDVVLNSNGDKIYNPDLEITNEVNTSYPGIYPVVYKIADYYADTAVVLMVEISG